MRREEALRILASHRAELDARFGVESMAIFGSTARDEAGPGSDVDVLVALRTPVGLFALARLQSRLEDILGLKVDLVTASALKPRYRDDVLGEAVYVA